MTRAEPRSSRHSPPTNLLAVASTQRVVLLTTSLIDRSRIGGAAEVVHRLSAAEVVRALIAIVDLEHPPRGWEEALAASGVTWVAVVPHVDDAARRRAMEQGAARVVTRRWLFGAPDPRVRIAELSAAAEAGTL